MYRAGLVNRISRGIYRISAEGLAFLAEKPSDLEVYRKTCGLIKQRNPRNTTKNRVESKIDERQDEEEIKSPQEMIEDSIEEINSSLADELLDTILDKDPRFFEDLIVDLLVKMGYGQGRATQYVSDSGSTESSQPTRSVLIPFIHKQSDTPRTTESATRIAGIRRRAWQCGTRRIYHHVKL